MNYSRLVSLWVFFFLPSIRVLFSSMKRTLSLNIYFVLGTVYIYVISSGKKERTT